MAMISDIRPDRVDDRDRAEFAKMADEIVAKGGVGFGELSFMHLSLWEGHPFKEIQPDHPLILLLADLAAKHGVPLDFHMEAVAKKWMVPKEIHEKSTANPNYIDENITALERLLAHNRKAKIIWPHLGTDKTNHRSPALTRRLLRTYPNLFISITGTQNARKYRLISGGSRLDPDWRNLIMEFPDRFMIGSDKFYVPNSSKLRERRDADKRAMQIIRLPFLSPAVARKVAFENAQRIFKLKLIDPDEYPLPAGGDMQVGQQDSGSGFRRSPDARSAGRGGGGGGPDASRIIARMDKDGDGRISKDEFQGPKNRFGRIDRDGDGYLSKAEFAVVLGRRQGRGPNPAEDPNAAWHAKLPIILTHAHLIPTAVIIDLCAPKLINQPETIMSIGLRDWAHKGQ